MDHRELLEQIRLLIREELKVLRPKEFLIIKEASALTRLSVGSIYNMVNERKIPFIKPSGKLIFSYDALVDWMLSKAVAPKADAYTTQVGDKLITIRTSSKGKRSE